MLRARPDVRAFGREVSAVEDSAQVSIGPGDIASILKLSWLPVFACAVLAFAISGAYIATSEPRFVGRAQILIEPQRPQMFWQEPGMLDLTMDNAQVESQLEVLRSEKIATAVINSLGLRSDPDFQDTPKRSWLGPLTTAVASTGFGVKLATASDDLAKMRSAIGTFATHLSARRVGQSYAIEIAYQASHPEQASRITNAITAAYMQDQVEAKAQVARLGGDWLQERIEEVRRQLHEASRRVEEFKTSNSLVDTMGKGFLTEQQLSETNSQLVTARVQSAQAAARFARLRQLSEHNSEVAVAEVLNNPVITNLRQRRQDAVAKEAELLLRYGASHPAVISARDEIRVIEQSIGTELARIVQIYGSELEIAKTREKDAEAQLQALVQEAEHERTARVTLSDLESQAQSYRKMYQSLLEKRTETAQKMTLPVTSARVITAATPPLGKSGPNSKLILALAGSASLLTGLCVGIARRSLARTSPSPDGLKAVGVGCLGALPIFRSNGRGAGRRVAEIIDDPRSTFSRAVHKVRVSIDVATAGTPLTIIGVTSVDPGEGKSTVALNLALSFLAAGRNTLLIDGNLESPTLAHRFEAIGDGGVRPGLATPTAIQPAWRSQLGFLALVNERDVVRAGGVPHGPSVEALFKKLTSAYDVVLVDLAALRSSADARAISSYVHAEILVAEWGRTTLQDLLGGAEVLQSGGTEFLGVVLNRCNDRSLVARTL